MTRRAAALVLAALLAAWVGSCAHDGKTVTVQAPVTRASRPADTQAYVLPLDALDHLEFCVEVWTGDPQVRYRCAPVWEVRAFLAQRQRAD